MRLYEIVSEFWTLGFSTGLPTVMCVIMLVFDTHSNFPLGLHNKKYVATSLTELGKVHSI